MNVHAKHTLYLFPGQGSDSAIYSKMTFPDSFDVKFMSLPLPDENETLEAYALRFVQLIDTSKDFSLIGVSLGGMICSELADTLNPKNVILISSAKCALELPKRYRFQQKVKLNKSIPAKWYKSGALFLQPLVEPDRNNEKETFVQMLSSKDSMYLKRTADMIINWRRLEYDSSIYHIHGDKDHTIPLRNVKANTIVDKGSHMMALTRSKEIEKLIVNQLQN